MESPRFENQSDAEDYIRELESKRQITVEALTEIIDDSELCDMAWKYADLNDENTDFNDKKMSLAKSILSKYRVTTKEQPNERQD